MLGQQRHWDWLCREQTLTLKGSGLQRPWAMQHTSTIGLRWNKAQSKNNNSTGIKLHCAAIKMKKRVRFQNYQTLQLTLLHCHCRTSLSAECVVVLSEPSQLRYWFSAHKHFPKSMGRCWVETNWKHERDKTVHAVSKLRKTREGKWFTAQYIREQTVWERLKLSWAHSGLLFLYFMLCHSSAKLA